MSLKVFFAFQKYGGSGEFHYRSSIVGYCYPCNGSGRLKHYTHKSFAISINDETGNPFSWLNVTARSKAEAVRKTYKIGENGCYKDRLDSITAAENGVNYTYSIL
ncbi:MAG: hypothetical protein K2N61_08350 [Lachnospiraceae bacterium]|nr:hypothetical protein [Lachnospiraceae bacterium]